MSTTLETDPLATGGFYGYGVNLSAVVDTPTTVTCSARKSTNALGIRLAGHG
jgi:hypothetical protein